MASATSTCGDCRKRDIATAIERSGLSDRDLLKRGQNVGFVVGSEAGTCNHCDRLVTLWKTCFGKEEDPPFGSNVAMCSIAHPVLTDYAATSFSLSTSGVGYQKHTLPPKYLLPQQARFVHVKSYEHVYLPYARSLDPEHVDVLFLKDASSFVDQNIIHPAASILTAEQDQ